MRIYFNLFISTILIIPISSFGQNINSYNIDAKLNSEDKTIEIYQVMKFKNTSNVLLKEIYLEDWSNSYIDNTTKLAKRISDEYSRSFSFAQKKQRGSTLINNIANWVNVDAYKLLNLTFGGSGYDIACASHNSPITYLKKQSERFIKGEKSRNPRT